MSVFRRLLVLAAAAALAGAFAQASSAARPDPADLPNTVGTTHFLVHYQSDSVDDGTAAWAITQTQAGDIGALAERAYTSELADGYSAPLSDGTLGGDGRIDIYVVDLTNTGALAYTVPDTYPASQTSSYIELGGNDLDGMNQHTIAHELFHVLQLSTWQTSVTADGWLYEATAEWMGYRADAYSAQGDNFLDLGTPDVSLDCRDPNGQYMCNTTDGYLNGGYEKWPFFEYLSERFGTSFVGSIFAAGGRGAGTSTQSLESALAAKGTTLASTFNAWALFDLQGLYTPKTLQGLTPTPYKTIQTGDKAGTVASTTVSVDHLAWRMLEFDRGAADPSELCHPATLAITVTFPTATSAQPVFWWKQNGVTSAPVALSVNGGTAKASIPWDTCTWASGAGFLTLPNASTSLDSADFTVTATMTVDEATPASSVSPPAPVEVDTPVVPVTAAESAPVVDASGPELIQLDAGDKTIRLIVESNGEGSVTAAIGSLTLGTVTIRPGANDVRFALPASLLLALRRSAATNLLVLTPVSPQGHVLGAPVLRKIAIAPAKPAAKKHAPKKKRPHK